MVVTQRVPSLVLSRPLRRPDGSFDGVLCSHVLEHVEDDAAAMSELRRVTAPGGWCLVMVPIDPGREETYADPAIATPEERAAVETALEEPGPGVPLEQAARELLAD